MMNRQDRQERQEIREKSQCKVISHGRGARDFAGLRNLEKQFLGVLGVLGGFHLE